MLLQKAQFDDCPLVCLVLLLLMLLLLLMVLYVAGWSVAGPLYTWPGSGEVVGLTSVRQKLLNINGDPIVADCTKGTLYCTSRYAAVRVCLFTRVDLH